jgi:hypothetical protein
MIRAATADSRAKCIRRARKNAFGARNESLFAAESELRNDLLINHGRARRRKQLEAKNCVIDCRALPYLSSATFESENSTAPCLFRQNVFMERDVIEIKESPGVLHRLQWAEISQLLFSGIDCQK